MFDKVGYEISTKGFVENVKNVINTLSKKDNGWFRFATDGLGLLAGGVKNVSGLSGVAFRLYQKFHYGKVYSRGDIESFFSKYWEELNTLFNAYCIVETAQGVTKASDLNKVGIKGMIDVVASNISMFDDGSWTVGKIVVGEVVSIFSKPLGIVPFFFNGNVDTSRIKFHRVMKNGEEDVAAAA